MPKIRGFQTLTINRMLLVDHEVSALNFDLGSPDLLTKTLFCQELGIIMYTTINKWA